MTPTQTQNIALGLPKLFLNQSILDIFVLQNIIDPADAEQLKAHFKTNRDIENFLIKNRLVTRDTINKAYSILLKLPFIELKNVEIPEKAMSVIPEKLAMRFKILPFGLEDNVLRLAICRPSDLTVSYATGLNDILKNKGLTVELFITGESDFLEGLKQYNKKDRNQLLLKKGSLPVIFLRNQELSPEYLHRLPREFIEKYRLAVFGGNAKGHYQVACQTPDSSVTRKIIEFLEKENHIRIEPYATSKDDIDFVIAHYDQGTIGKLDVEKEADDSKERDAGKRREKENSSFKDLLKNFLGSGGPDFTVDGEVAEEEAAEEKTLKKEDSSSVEDKVLPSAQAKPNEDLAVTEDQKEKKEDKRENGKKEKEEAQGEESASEGGAVFTSSAGKPMEAKEGESSVADVEVETEKSDDELGSLLTEDIATTSQLDAIIKEGYVPKIVAALINFALSHKSSDIHIEPQVKTLRARCRIDGVLEDVAKMPLSMHPQIISRIKILSRLKIDESRIPQDGRFSVAFKDKEVDVRVSSLPTVHGEKIVLRVLDKSQKILSLEDLGMQGSSFDNAIAAIAKPWGVILSTGPTGSGKSTTLNAIINRLNVPDKNIITLEDPVEYETAGVNQCQVKPEIGFTFASGLRSVLRQDPNIIMVGEIRDAETAGMVTHAALTGHLVLSTLHTNDTSGSLPRLINMGIEPFLITSSINLVIAQRLIRLICPKCKEEVKLPAKLLDDIKAELQKIPPNTRDAKRIPQELRFFYGRGCPECTQGYRGRIGIFETLIVSDKIEELAVARRPANEIKDAAIAEGMITMKQDGILKALAGLTTIDEVFQAAIDS